MQNVKQVFLDIFVAHKNAVFFVFVRLKNFKLLCFLRENFTHKKAQKAHIGEQATFFPLDVFLFFFFFIYLFFLSAFKTIFLVFVCLTLEFAIYLWNQ